MKTTRNQQFAALAFEQVSALKNEQRKEFREKYGRLAHRMPFLVRSAGLAQALEFIAARGGTEGTEILDHLARNLQKTDGGTLRQDARRAPLNDYMRLTRDVMAALQWYKRFAQSVLDVEAGEEDS